MPWHSRLVHLCTIPFLGLMTLVVFANALCNQWWPHRELGVLTPPPGTSRQDQFSTSSKSLQMLGLGWGPLSRLFKWMWQSNYVIALVPWCPTSSNLRWLALALSAMPLHFRPVYPQSMPF